MPLNRVIHDRVCRIRSGSGILTFDRTLDFYNLSANIPQANQLVVADLEIFVPLRDGSSIDPCESRSVEGRNKVRIFASFAGWCEVTTCIAPIRCFNLGRDEAIWL
ncbi:hypothetical protein PAXRUDRAFT_297602 [Paxillus rubicundulus Ve08.2h10]|uniref:Uncharacterized protein n=1 Tax=Paxillus rubicundulus Ve08.2h10 TaxID=930991 RepID=A0A0D0DL61_9AGAM|nr:hypothetical protein PAXRUDRAFT_297602 [Paxillus rubicundulus Ve08.2h10]